MEYKWYKTLLNCWIVTLMAPGCTNAKIFKSIEGSTVIDSSSSDDDLVTIDQDPIDIGLIEPDLELSLDENA